MSIFIITCGFIFAILCLNNRYLSNISAVITFCICIYILIFGFETRKDINMKDNRSINLKDSNSYPIIESNYVSVLKDGSVESNCVMIMDGKGSKKTSYTVIVPSTIEKKEIKRVLLFK